MPVRDVDVCVVGGGLAGAAAACALRRAGLSVLVIERRSETGDMHRGDCLRPWAVAQLASWGVDLLRRKALPVTRLAVESAERTLAERDLDEKALCLPHPQLELAVREAARDAGAELLVGFQVHHLLQTAEGRVSGAVAVRGAEAVEVRCRLLVGADGRSSLVRDALGLRLRKEERRHELVAAEAEVPGTDQASERILFRVGAQGGGMLVPLAPRRARVVAVVGLGESDALVRLTPDLLVFELSRRTPLPRSALIDPGRVRSYDLTGGGHALNYVTRGAVCLGDAVHAGPPPSGEGMQMALKDVEALARLVAPAARGGEKALDKALDRYERERWPDNEQRLARAHKTVRLLSPEPGRLVDSPLARLAVRSLLAVD